MDYENLSVQMPINKLSSMMAPLSNWGYLGVFMAKWIICCGMMRSASTLQYQIVKEIVESHQAGKAIGVLDLGQFDALSEKHKSYSGYIVVKTHDYFDQASELNRRQLLYPIFSYRDVRDVVVSLMNKESKRFERVFSSQLANYLLETFGKWTSLNQIHISAYEDIWIDLQAEIQKIADFIQIPLKAGFKDSASKKLGLDQQKRYIKSSDFKKTVITSGKFSFSTETLLHPNHVASGETEQWKEKLAPAQIGLIQHYFKPWLTAQGYELVEIDEGLYKSKIQSERPLTDRIKRALSLWRQRMKHLHLSLMSTMKRTVLRRD